MAKSVRGRRRLLSRQFRSTPYPIPAFRWEAPEKEAIPKKTCLTVEKKDWEDATCSVCMEFPHNAVLLLCSSHDKGCRPYMCGTSYRHSNCLDQFKKAYTKEMSYHHENPFDMPGWPSSENSEAMELACPLCRGQVKGWTVVEPAREYLDNKKRSCMQDGCSFMGTYRDLRKHVRSEHPSAKPREVDPLLEQKWRSLEHERERQDVISTIRSSMPGSMVLGDYVIEINNSDMSANADGDFEGGRGLSPSALYYILQESVRLLRLHRDTGASDGREDDHGDEYFGSPDGQLMGEGMLRSDRRRRRRRRSRGGSVFGES